VLAHVSEHAQFTRQTVSVLFRIHLHLFQHKRVIIHTCNHDLCHNSSAETETDVIIIYTVTSTVFASTTPPHTYLRRTHKHSAIV